MTPFWQQDWWWSGLLSCVLGINFQILYYYLKYRQEIESN